MANKKICLTDIALGLTRKSQKKVAAKVDSLVKKEAINRERLEKLLSDAQTEGAECKKTIGTKVQSSVKKVLGELGFVASDDVAQLHKEIKALKISLCKEISTGKT